VLIYVATKNEGKFRELRDLFAPHGWRLATFDDYPDVEEGDVSYADNAARKARALRAGLLAGGIVAPVLGDDSGLEVSALAGRPGVLSARYGSPGSGWHERRLQLLKELDRSCSPDRSARFVCALHFIGEDGRIVSVEQDVAGVISSAERGAAGFSYDAIFWYPPLDSTFAELEESRKNAVSHRGRAVASLLTALRTPVPAAIPENGPPDVKNTPTAGM